MITCGQHKIESKIEKKAVGNVDKQTDGYAAWVLIVQTSGSFLLYLSGLWVNLPRHLSVVVDHRPYYQLVGHRAHI